MQYQIFSNSPRNDYRTFSKMKLHFQKYLEMIKSRTASCLLFSWGFGISSISSGIWSSVSCGKGVFHSLAKLCSIAQATVILHTFSGANRISACKQWNLLLRCPMARSTADLHLLWFALYAWSWTSLSWFFGVSL